jgi:hypothetical protein
MLAYGLDVVNGGITRVRAVQDDLRYAHAFIIDTRMGVLMPLSVFGSAKSLPQWPVDGRVMDGKWNFGSAFPSIASYS